MQAVQLFCVLILSSSIALADKYVIYDDAERPLSSQLQSMFKGSSKVLTLELTADEASDLKAKGVVIEPRVIFKKMGWVEEGPVITAEWAADAMRVTEAHNLSNSKGSGQKICVIDTGIDRNHTLLRGKVLSATSQVPSEQPHDLEGHGTHVASLIVGSSDLGSPAPSAKIVSVKALSDKGFGYSDWIAAAVGSCVDQGTKIINMSLGTPTASEVVRLAVRDAIARGVTVVAASGNNGGALIYPAAFPGVISVGATTSSGQIASFSNFGPGLGYVAPGSKILGARTGGGTVVLSGTSMAAPFVAGIVALRRSKGTRSIGTNDLGFSSNKQGQGQVDAYKTATN